MDRTQPRARKLIDEAVDLDSEDLAYDFIETQIGRFYFDSSWKIKRDKYSARLKEWLETQGQGERYDPVVKIIDDLAATGLSWNDRWADDYGGMDKPKSSKKSKPKRSQVNGDPNRTQRSSPT